MIARAIQALQTGFIHYPLGSFVILHGLGGRAASILAARLAGFNMAIYLPLAICLDMVQVPLFFLLYQEGSQWIIFLKKLGDRAQRQKEKLASSAFYERLVRWGPLGVLVVTLLPIKGGGMWSGVLLAHILKVERGRAYLLLFAGSLLGAFLLMGLSDLILKVWTWLWQE